MGKVVASSVMMNPNYLQVRGKHYLLQISQQFLVCLTFDRVKFDI